MERNIVYLGAGGGFLCAVITLLVIALGVTCCMAGVCGCCRSKMISECKNCMGDFKPQDVESVDAFTAKMLSLLVKVEHIEEVSPEVKDEIKAVNRYLAGLLAGGVPPNHDYNYPYVPPPTLPPNNLPPNNLASNNLPSYSNLSINTNNSYGITTGGGYYSNMNGNVPTNSNNTAINIPNGAPLTTHRSPTPNVSPNSNDGGTPARQHAIALDGNDEPQELDNGSYNQYEEIPFRPAEKRIHISLEASKEGIPPEDMPLELQSSPTISRGYSYEEQYQRKPTQLNAAIPLSNPIPTFTDIPLNNLSQQQPLPPPFPELRKEILMRFFPQTVAQVKTQCPNSTNSSM